MASTTVGKRQERAVVVAVGEDDDARALAAQGSKYVDERVAERVVERGGAARLNVLDALGEHVSVGGEVGDELHVVAETETMAMRSCGPAVLRKASAALRMKSIRSSTLPETSRRRTRLKGAVVGARRARRARRRPR
jgi:hypothetical protein